MRVLITQSAQDAATSAAQLSARGHDVLSVPLISFERVASPKINLAAAQGFLVTSPEGARALAENIGVRTFPAFTDSEVTAAELTRLGFKNVQAAKDDSADLARLVERSLKPVNGALIYACSTNPAIQLTAMLSNMGFAVRSLPLFGIKRVTALPAELRTALENNIEAALFLTPDEARAFVALVQQEKLEQKVARLPTVAATPIVAAPLRALKLGGVTVPVTGDLDTVFSALDTKLVDKVEEERLERERRAKEEADRLKAEEERVARERAEEERLRKEADEQARARAEAERLAKEQAEKEAAEKKRLEREQAEREKEEKRRVEKERADADRAEKERRAKELAEADRLLREKAAAEKAKRDQMAREEAAKQHAEKVRLAEEKAEKDRIERERLALERTEKERILAAQREAERLERMRLAEERAERDRQEREREARERASFDAIAFEQAERARAEKERLALEKAERDRIEKERLARENAEQERIAAERAAEVRAENERLALERSEQKRLEKEQAAAEKAERDRLAREEAERQRIEKARLVEERAAAARAEKERVAAEKAERDRIARAEHEKAKQEQAEAKRLERERFAQEKAERKAREQAAAADAPAAPSWAARFKGLFAAGQAPSNSDAAPEAAPTAWDMPLTRPADTAAPADVPARYAAALTDDALFESLRPSAAVAAQPPSATMAEAVAPAVSPPPTQVTDVLAPQPKEEPAVPPNLPQVDADPLTPNAETSGDGARDTGPKSSGRAARLLAEDAADNRAQGQRFRHFNINEPESTAPAEAAETQTPPPRPRRSSGGRVVALFLVLALMVVGVIGTASWWVPRVMQTVRGTPEPAAPVAVVAQTPVVAPVPAAPPVAAPAPAAVTPAPTPTPDAASITARMTALEQQLAQHIATVGSQPGAAGSAEAMTSLSGSLSSQAQQLAAVTARLATMEAAIGNVARLEELSREMKMLEAKSAQANSVLALSDRVTALETTARQAVVAHTSNIALLLAVAQWRDAVAAGRPFALELETVKAVAARTASTSVADAGFAEFAARGLPTLQDLQRRFGETAAAVVRANAMPDATSGWVNRIMERLLAIVTIRRTDGDVAGDSVSAILARAERRVNEGNLAGAVEEMNALQGQAATAAAPWLGPAKARVAAEQSMTEATTRAVAALAVTADKPGE